MKMCSLLHNRMRKKKVPEISDRFQNELERSAENKRVHFCKPSPTEMYVEKSACPAVIIGVGFFGLQAMKEKTISGIKMRFMPITICNLVRFLVLMQ